MRKKRNNPFSQIVYLMILAVFFYTIYIMMETPL